MTRILPASVLAPLLLLGACATAHRPPATATPVPEIEIEADESARWRGIASARDEDRVDQIGHVWAEALADLRRAPRRSDVSAEGELLDPNAALPRPAPPPGPYRCRVVKLGKVGRAPAFTAFKPFFCYVEAEDDLLTIVKQTGSQRPAGRLYPDSDPQRLVFLGTLALGAGEEPLPYGEDATRDLAGVVERVAPFRWRLVIPRPQPGSKLDVIELVPATG